MFRGVVFSDFRRSNFFEKTVAVVADRETVSGSFRRGASRIFPSVGVRKEVEAILGWKSAIFGAAVSQSVAEKCSKAKRKRSRILRSLLRGVKQEILQALLEVSKEERRKDDTEERRKKQQQWRRVGRPSCAKNSSVSALISIVCFLLGRRGFWAQDGSREWLRIGELRKRPLIIYNRVCAGGVCVWKRSV